MHFFATFVLLYVCSEMIIFLNKKRRKRFVHQGPQRDTNAHLVAAKGVVCLHVD